MLAVEQAIRSIAGMVLCQLSRGDGKGGYTPFDALFASFYVSAARICRIVESKCPADMKRDKEQRKARYRNFFQSRTSRNVPTGHFAQPPRPQYSVQSWITACESDALRRSKASCQSRV